MYIQLFDANLVFRQNLSYLVMGKMSLFEGELNKVAAYHFVT